jgi:hypothetical protein
MYDLATSGHVVVGLPRKSKNGTRFSIQKTGCATGYATVVRTTKDGQVFAKLDGTGLQFTFHTKNKAVWPDAVPATRFKKVA